jgi:transcriptional regulator with XRE-family HTH domain
MNTPELKKLLSQNIKNKRYSLGLSQEKLAFLAGIDRTYMSEVERELANPTIEVLLKISNALGLTPQDLLKP